MVRVISVHNFEKQDISSVDELIDLTVVPPDVLLLVQSDHTISVKNLSLANDNGYVIPTVDQVVKVIYSVQGNYIGTLERKVTRSGVDVFYVRIYLNWESLRMFKEPPPMRARIAGRVTPLSQNHEGLEMIEIPANNMPDNIACCPISGNMIMSCKNVLVIYKLKIEMHDISKMHFIDFEEIPVGFLLSFVPLRMEFVENMIAVQNDEFLHIFKINSDTLYNGNDMKDRQYSSDDLDNVNDNSLKGMEAYGIINYDKLTSDANIKFKYFNIASTKYKDVSDQYSELSKINHLSFPVKHDFPTVATFKTTESKCGDIHKQNPFLTGHDLIVNMINTSESENSKLPCTIENILQYQLMPLMLGSTTNRDIQEKFTCLVLKPYYSADFDPEIVKPTLLGSEYSGKLKTVACFFGTQQEGYLFCFEYDASSRQDFIQDYMVYPFTAPVIDVKLEDAFLHALTDTGLETYTMRSAKHIMKSNGNKACPSADDPICLIGLRPFVNVFKMSLTNHYLLLFANNEESNGSWTMYKLKLPSPLSVWNDFLVVAEENKWEAPSTYCHLVGEGHLILKTYLNTTKWISHVDQSGNHLNIPAPFVHEKERKLTEKLYNETCALLGDFHVLSGDFLKASNYYTMSSYKVSEIIRRIETLEDKIPEKGRGSYDSNFIKNGLIFHLKRALAFYDEKYSAFTGNREEFYTLEIGNIVNSLLDYLEKECNLSISDLILDSVVLREFSTDRILKMMKNLISKSSPPQEKDALSLALMCIQRDQTEQAKAVLRTITPQGLSHLLLQYDHLLFEKNKSCKVRSFTELSMVLIETYPSVIGKLLSHLVTEKFSLSLSMLLKIFLDILPSGTVQSRNSSVVLQIVLENYFKGFFAQSRTTCDFKMTEALKILIRIYLTFLRQKIKPNMDFPTNVAEEEILFYKCRREYLKYLPPFGPDFSEFLSPIHSASIEDSSAKEIKFILLQIQSLLSYENIPPECVAEVRNYICNQVNVYGSLSLQVLSATNNQEALQLLINFAPQAVVQYTKDCVKGIDDWKFIVKQLQMKINAADEDLRRKFYYQQVLTDILLHGAKSLEIEDLVEVLPQDFDDGGSYLTLAQNNAQANHIRTLVMTTGKQLQTTFYEGNSTFK